MKNFLNYIADPDNFKKIKTIFKILLVLVVIADFLVEREHAALVWEKIPGWSAFLGFATSIFLMLVPRFVGDIWLYKGEDYYGE